MSANSTCRLWEWYFKITLTYLPINNFLAFTSFTWISKLISLGSFIVEITTRIDISKFKDIVTYMGILYFNHVAIDYINPRL